MRGNSGKRPFCARLDRPRCPPPPTCHCDRPRCPWVCSNPNGSSELADSPRQRQARRCAGDKSLSLRAWPTWVPADGRHTRTPVITRQQPRQHSSRHSARTVVASQRVPAQRTPRSPGCRTLHSHSNAQAWPLPAIPPGVWIIAVPHLRLRVDAQRIFCVLCDRRSLHFCSQCIEHFEQIRTSSGSKQAEAGADGPAAGGGEAAS